MAQARWCHLTADSPEEQHALAAQLGLVRQWFQSKPGRPCSDHYDLPEEVRAQAIACGARPLGTREMARRQAKLARDPSRGIAPVTPAALTGYWAGDVAGER